MSKLVSHAFGIAIRSNFRVPGLPEEPPPDSLPVTELKLVSEEELEAAWSPTDPQRILEETFEGDEPARSIDFDAEQGYRLFARHFGLALITRDGSSVLCAPPGATDWSWQRFLVGRVLPWTALARGIEVFHASAVAIEGRAIAFIGVTGGGKTSMALQLMARGAGFITDDVLAIEIGKGGPLGHPGANITAVRPAVKACLSEDEWGRLGTDLGHSVKTYVEVEREPSRLPIEAIYFLAPASASAAIDDEVEPRELLAATFITSIPDPARLAGLLDLCADLSSSVPLRRLWIEPDCGAKAAAAEVLERTAAVESQ